MNSYTNIYIFGYDIIVQKLQKPYEIRVAIQHKANDEVKMPPDRVVAKIVKYLGAEGFFDNGASVDEDCLAWVKGEPAMKLAVGHLPPHKFKQLQHKLEKHHG